MSREIILRRSTIAAAAAIVFGLGTGAAAAQSPPPLFSGVIRAVREVPGCLGVETGQTAGGRRVIFAWFESKQALVAWYRSEAHQRAMKTVFPG
jgi:quinol monooxygenase YgiN